LQESTNQLEVVDITTEGQALYGFHGRHNAAVQFSRIHILDMAIAAGHIQVFALSRVAANRKPKNMIFPEYPKQSAKSF
jgi:hypothetical protein